MRAMQPDDGGMGGLLGLAQGFVERGFVIASAAEVVFGDFAGVVRDPSVYG